MTEILSVDPSTNYRDAVRRACEVVRDGGIIAYPTETFYGLGVNVYDERALVRLAREKGRGEEKPFPVIVANINMVITVAEEIPELAHHLMDEFWPGPLTLLLPAKNGLSAEVAGKDVKIGVRISSHPLATSIVQELGIPLTATSANPAGGKSPVFAGEVQEAFSDRIELILDMGKLPGRKASTVLDMTVSPPEFLREGECDVKRVQHVIQRYEGV